MRRIGAPAVWNRLPVSTITPRVAVLDVGIMDTHPDLAGQADNSVSTAYCSTSGGTNNSAGYPIYSTFIDFGTFPIWSPDDGCTPLGFDDYEFHGTHVAGTIAAKFGGGKAVGVAPDAKVGAYKVFDIFQYQGDLYVGAFDGPIFVAIIDAAYKGYGVISMSLGSTLYRNNKGDNASWLAWDRVAKWANRQGVVIVAAAGNTGLSLNGHIANIPSDLSTVVSVSASAASLLAKAANGYLSLAPGYPDVLASYSNFGAAVNITAPGGDCLDAACDDGHYFILNDGISETGAATYHLAAGTSMATPHVSVVAAYVRAIHPDWTPGKVRAWLQSTAQMIGNRQGFGHGMVNADAAAR
jgi:subtilisin family serine protease